MNFPNAAVIVTQQFATIALNIILGETCKHLMDKLHENLSEHYFLENLTHCPYPDCSGRFIVEDGDKYNRITCQVCKRAFCYSCKVPWHETYTCHEWMNRNDIWTQQERKSINTIKKISRPCPQCHIGIEKNGGCDSVTCTCSTTFDYASAAWH